MNSSSLHVASYNIHKGYCAKNRRFVLDEIRKAIRDLNPDILFLQEVVGHGLSYKDHSHDNAATQFEYLADEIWPHLAYGKNAIYDHGHHGNAILSKHAFQHSENIDITQWQFSQRGVLMGKLDNGVNVLCAHFGLIGLERRYQMKELLKFIDQHIPISEPLIIAGDFNDWSLRLHRHFIADGFKEAHSEHKMRPARTFPAKMPLLSVDRIYFRNLVLEKAQVLKKAPWTQLSDHCAIDAKFLLRCEM